MDADGLTDMAISNGDSGTASRKAPPYTSYPSMRTLVASLKANGVPGRIDRSMLKTFSNAVGTQLITGLKFLKLISEEQRPTQTLLDLVDSFEGPSWPAELSGVLKAAYPEMFAITLESASPAEFSEAFRRAYGVDGETLEKCARFFIAAAQDADFPISKYILSNKKPRKGGPKKRAAKPVASKSNTVAAGGSGGNGSGNGNSDFHKPNALKPSEILLSHLKDMGPQEQEAAWVLMKHFAAKSL